MHGLIDDQVILLAAVVGDNPPEAAGIGIFLDKALRVFVDDDALNKFRRWRNCSGGGDTVHFLCDAADTLAQANAAAVTAGAAYRKRTGIERCIAVHKLLIEGKAASTKYHATSGADQHALAFILLQLFQLDVLLLDPRRQKASPAIDLADFLVMGLVGFGARDQALYLDAQHIAAAIGDQPDHRRVLQQPGTLGQHRFAQRLEQIGAAKNPLADSTVTARRRLGDCLIARQQLITGIIEKFPLRRIDGFLLIQRR